MVEDSIGFDALPLVEGGRFLGYFPGGSGKHLAVRRKQLRRKGEELDSRLRENDVFIDLGEQRGGP